MNEMSNTKKDNKLKAELGLVDKSRLDLFLENPRYIWFRDVPKADQTPEIVTLAVTTDGESIRCVSKNLITEELCKIAVTQNGLLLKYIPENYMTKDIIKTAVEQNPMAISFVPKNRITKSISISAVCKNVDDPGYENNYPIAYIPKRFIDEKLVTNSIENSPLSVKDIPKEYLTKDILLLAVSKDTSTLEYISRNRFSKRIIETAISKDPLSIKYFPKGKLTKEICTTAISSNPLSLEFVPEEKLTKEICDLAFGLNPFVIDFIPKEYITHDMCLTVISKSCYDNTLERVDINWFPQILQDDINIKKALKEYYSSAFDSNPVNMLLFPEQYITQDMCLTFIEVANEDQVKESLKLILISAGMEKNIPVIDALINKIGAQYIIQWDNERHTNEHFNHFLIKRLSHDTVAYLQSKNTIYNNTELKISDNSEKNIKYEIINVETPLQSSDTTIAYDNRAYLYDMTINVTNDYLHSISIYYISDLHLEHQFKQMLKKGTSLDELSAAIEDRINDMVSEVDSLNQRIKILLIGGDVSDHQELVELFFKILRKKWSSRIIYVLGNHELWDNKYECPALNDSLAKVNNIDNIVNDYRTILSENEYGSLLQNDLLIFYKNRFSRIINETQILNATDEDLRDILSQCTLIILGGIGFSGLNSYYNAESGLYGKSVTTVEEDRILSSRFKRVYDRINLCAGDIRVIVFTHNPVYDWSTDGYNPNWIYINGHTHNNSIIRELDGTTVLSDNQVGYKPSTWKLKAVKITGWYDLFRDMSDGIHEITRDMYLEFNSARGITVKSCNYEGNVVVLKRNGYYMFLLRCSNKLYLLSGGRRRRLKISNENYYYENMDKYIQKIHDAISPYQEALKAISKEVKLIGGNGNIHGCIVDINFFNHIYLNPYDGKITPYFAYSMNDKYAFKDLPSLLEYQLPELLSNFKRLQTEDFIPLLSQYAVSTRKECLPIENVIIPQLVLGTEMYEPSRDMRSVQYIFDNNVIRTWNDDILMSDHKKTATLIKHKHNTLPKTQSYDENEKNSTNPIVDSHVDEYALGNKVEHKKFGLGVIIESTQLNQNRRLIKVKYEFGGIGIYFMPDDNEEFTIIK